MDAKLWKYVAIIFIAITLIVVSYLAWVFFTVDHLTKLKIKCADEVCYNAGATQFRFDSGVCDCFNEFNEKVYSERLQ